MLPLMLLESVDSTSRYWRDMAASIRLPHGSAVAALRQTEGRGRSGRVWHSVEGNIFLSVFLRLSRQAEPALSMVMAVAVAEALLALGAPPHRLKLKWPNDLWFDGRKLGGILLDQDGEALIVGVGINRQHQPEGMEAETASLAGIIHAPYGQWLESLQQAIVTSFSIWESEGLGRFIEAFSTHAIPQHTPITIHDASGSKFSGCYQGVDAHGHLQLLLASGETASIAYAEAVDLDNHAEWGGVE